MRKCIAAAAIAAFSSFAYAADPLLLRLPTGVSDADVMKAVANAFEKREWEVKKESEQSVAAYIDHDATKSSVEIYRAGDELYYRDLGTTKRLISGGEIQVMRKIPPPERWMTFLRTDLERAIGLLDRKSAEANGTVDKNDIAARLTVLQALHEDGLISDDEYAAKRREVLSGL